MRVNKFNASWQLCRVQAKKIKNVDEKISLVREYLNNNKNIYDKQRVENWAKTTMLAFNQDDVKSKFKEMLRDINCDDYSNVDNDSTLRDLSKKEITLIYNDLKQRKYNFQFNKVPQDHIIFMDKLKEIIDE